MDTTYDVRINETEVYQGKKTTTYWVRWTVAGKRWKEPFKHSALAVSFRSALLTAAKKGEAFYVDTGRPVTMSRVSQQTQWFQLAVEYADKQWPKIAATTRRTNAEALAKATIALIKPAKGQPADRLLRSVLNRVAFNPLQRNDPYLPDETRQALAWLARNTKSVTSLARPEVLRPVLDGYLRRLDGGRAAPSVASRQRRIFNAVLNYAAEKQLLNANPIKGLAGDVKAAVRVNVAVDKRSVPNPVQVRTLLNAMRGLCWGFGSRYVAFFGCMYYTFMRPEEVVGLRRSNLRLPEHGWGEIYLDVAKPYAGRDWTDTGEARDHRRQLKQRAIGEGRSVPCPPELTALLHEHINRYGLGPSGLVFTGQRNGKEVPKQTINNMLDRARKATFTPEAYEGELAAKPYDLRHAGISACLMAGIPAVKVAYWAGQSVEILNAVYAAWLDGTEQLWRNRMDELLNWSQA